jgi:hypothetical protein
VRGVVSFADPVPRRIASGLLVMPGHVGTIYAATHAVYADRATARTMKLLPDATSSIVEYARVPRGYSAAGNLHFSR